MRRKRYVIGETTGYAITAAGRTGHQETEVLVLDRDYAHRVVASFVGRPVTRTARTVSAARHAAAVFAGRLNARAGWTPDDQLLAARELSRANVPMTWIATATGLSRQQTHRWLSAGRPLRRGSERRKRCHKGHRYLPDNVVVYADGRRRCRRCMAAARERQWIRRQREQNARRPMSGEAA